MESSKFDRVELFFGEATDTLCRVYARAPRDCSTDGLRLSGSLSGPESKYSQTLPASYAFADLGPGPTVLAETIVPDPCFWSPETPQLYRAKLELRCGDEVLAQEQRLFGIRRLGVHGRDLIFERKRCVLRAVECPAPTIADFEAAHASNTTLFVARAEDAICQQASELGVLLITRVNGSAEQVVAEIRRLRRWPAVGVVVIDAQIDDARILHRERLNLILAQFIAAEVDIPAEWANMVVCPSDLVSRRSGPLPLPVMAYRSAGLEGAAIGVLRAECDRLQADLATVDRFAGYLV